MLKTIMRAILPALVVLCAATGIAGAQTTVAISDTAKQHIFRYAELSFIEDTTSKVRFEQIQSPEWQQKFRQNPMPTPVTANPASAYWYKLNIRHNTDSRNNWILEFFDQTIDSVTVYSPGRDGHYTAMLLGSNRPFTTRFFQHKNLNFSLLNSVAGVKTYYVRIKSHQSVNVIIVLRSVRWFISYALEEYFLFGIFYGMIMVFGLYNLIMFVAIRQRQYLYYIAYNISIGLYEMCADGIAYQYIWPYSPQWNHYAYGLALFAASIFAILFAQTLLSVKTRAPKLNRLLNWIMIARSIFFVACLFNKNWFSYKIIEIVPLTIAYITGCYILFKGYRPARFFVIGYTFLLMGFVIKAMIALNIWWLPVTAFDYYALSVCFILEMFFVSFAIGDRVRLLRVQKKNAQVRIIKELRENATLKDTINKRLEEQVHERTAQLVQKAVIIEQQNQELVGVNKLLKAQAEEISRMNVLLERDNTLLQNDIEKMTHDRVMSAEVDFEEFSKAYPDRETCFKFLADLKWEKGYKCRKCETTHYSSGHLPYSRRCTKCGYEESVIAYTILQNTRIPINKAFYIIFLMYSTKGKISSHKLSEILAIRQSTCWAYSSRIKKIMNNRKKQLSNAGDKGWSKLVMDLN
jgi:hypothetical protein